MQGERKRGKKERRQIKSEDGGKVEMRRNEREESGYCMVLGNINFTHT